MYSKFYFPQVMSFLSYPKKDTFAFEELYNYFGGCDCIWCKGKTPVEIGTGDKNVQLHHWQMMHSEIDKINSLSNDDRIPYVKQRIDEALNNLNSIPTTIINSQKNTDYYKLLKNLKRVL